MLKYIIGFCLAIMGIKAVMSTPELLSIVTSHKELVLALGLTVLAKPLVKRVFS